MLFSDREPFTRWLKAFTELAVSSVAALSLSSFLHYSGIMFHLYTLLFNVLSLIVLYNVDKRNLCVLYFFNYLFRLSSHEYNLRRRAA